MTPFDFTHIIPGDEIDPLKAAEDRVKEAEAEFNIARYRWINSYDQWPGRAMDAQQRLASATADLAALRRKLSAEADEIPFLPRDM